MGKIEDKVMLYQRRDWWGYLNDCLRNPDDHILGPAFLWDTLEPGQSMGDKSFQFRLKFENREEYEKFRFAADMVLGYACLQWELIQAEDPNGGEGEMKYEMIYVLERYEKNVNELFRLYV